MSIRMTSAESTNTTATALLQICKSCFHFSEQFSQRLPMVVGDGVVEDVVQGSSQSVVYSCDVGCTPLRCKSVALYKEYIPFYGLHHTISVSIWISIVSISAKPQTTLTQSLNSILEQHDHSIIKLMDDLHHLKYEHGIDRDDVLFDTAYDFFTENNTENLCDIGDCPFYMRYHGDRGQQEDQLQEDGDAVLLDIMSMIHCYLLHSYETQRFSKEERMRIKTAAGSLSWGTVSEVLRGDEENDETAHVAVMTVATNLLKEKQRHSPRRRRFRDVEGEVNTIDKQSKQFIDFAAMSRVVGIEETALREGLVNYKEDTKSLITDLIEVVYGEDEEKMDIWNSFDINNGDKRSTFRSMLHRHFQQSNLDGDNLINLFKFIIARKRLQIDIEQMAQLMTINEIDGRMFDDKYPDHYQNNGTFSNRFRTIPNCKVQHVRQLYSAVKKWKYIKWKQVTTESKEDDFIAADVELEMQSQQPDVYTIGKRFNFWQRKHKDFVQAKYKNMKEEMMRNPLLAKCIGVRAWNKLSATISIMVKTRAALRIESNGNAHYLFRIGKGEPFDEPHLCAIKLYTDLDLLCTTFCAILRRGDPAEIAGIANMARILTETVQCYGTSLSDDSSKSTYYRGVNKTFMFMTIVSRFNLPQSTTADVRKQSILFSF